MITYIFGAGGHALEVTAVALRAGTFIAGDPNVRFVVRDADDSRRSDLPFPVMAESDMVRHTGSDPVQAIVAIGASLARSRARRMVGSGSGEPLLRTRRTEGQRRAPGRRH